MRACLRTLSDEKKTTRILHKPIWVSSPICLYGAMQKHRFLEWPTASARNNAGLGNWLLKHRRHGIRKGLYSYIVLQESALVFE